MSSEKCIRVLADESQIKQCKADVAAIDESVQHLSALLSLAGNEARLKILFLLQQERQMCPCDLSDVLEMTVPAISQHLRKMKDKNLVQSRKVGQTVFYSINDSYQSLLQPLFKIVKEPSKL
ncbi:ArsR/SmtB family transcription factor [Nafulsella turpanensis]|uniref:ArsR/SmtB family transcription factor n=1 Tax=Nafulsella turpanensis TaxID=1265690 RepID=UPI00037B227B|nr:metalloregulator ArsR/SmtB family transcription factor [Nafulsella turpanensis]